MGDREVGDGSPDRASESVGVAVLPQDAVELQAPRRLQIPGDALRVVQHRVERFLRGLALEIAGQPLVPIGERERAVEPRG